MNKIASIQGMHDIGFPEIELWQWLEGKARRLLEAAHFSELRTPILEEEALFKRSLGDTADIVEKEMYTFQNSRQKNFVMRPEGTAPIVRAYLEHYVGQSQDQRFYYIGPMFRRERPQKGRYRQFHQVGAEVFGSSHFLTDVEILALIHTLFKILHIESVTLQLNSLGCPECRPSYRKALLDFLNPLASELCDDCQRRLTANPLRILDCKNETCRKLASPAPSGLDYLCSPCTEHFAGVQEGLVQLGISYTLNTRLVRGLDYYIRTAFEFTSLDLGAQSAVAGGGRYDGLVESLGGPKVAGVGFAIGLERLMSLIPKEKVQTPRLKKVFFACLGAAAQKVLFPVMVRMREEGGVVCYSDFDAPSLKSQMRYANRSGANWVVIAGDEELLRGVVQVKEMCEGGGQQEVPLEKLEELIRGLGAKSPALGN